MSEPNPAILRPSVRIIFPSDQRQMDEAPDRGYLSHILVDVGGDRLYPVFFFTPGRLAFELEQGVKHGSPYIAEVGMIVIPEISVPVMQQAIEALYAKGYFEHMKSLTQAQVTSADQWRWPPRPS